MSDARGNAEAHIEVRDLTMAYGDFVIQKNLTFTVRRGDIFIIMGGSGCGKSTLLKVMIGLKSPSAGDVSYEGEAFWAAGIERQEDLKRKFGTLFQSGALWSGMTLAENVALPLKQYTQSRPMRRFANCVRTSSRWSGSPVSKISIRAKFPAA